ncbi:Protein of unknown function [Gryllus bimaculatus]|nr:Protein of unknown function [Gryllus bimaculatus]
MSLLSSHFALVCGAHLCVESHKIGKSYGMRCCALCAGLQNYGVSDFKNPWESQIAANGCGISVSTSLVIIWMVSLDSEGCLPK